MSLNPLEQFLVANRIVPVPNSDQPIEMGGSVSFRSSTFAVDFVQRLVAQGALATTVGLAAGTTPELTTGTEAGVRAWSPLILTGFFQKKGAALSVPNGSVSAPFLAPASAPLKGWFFVSSEGQWKLGKGDGTNTGVTIFADYGSMILSGNLSVETNLTVAGTITGTTASPGTNSTLMATTAFVTAAVAAAGGGGGLSDASVGYIRTGGNDTTGDGSPSKPYATANKAFSQGFRSFDFGVGNFAALNIVGVTENISLFFRGKGLVLTTLAAVNISEIADGVTVQLSSDGSIDLTAGQAVGLNGNPAPLADSGSPEGARGGDGASFTLKMHGITMASPEVAFVVVGSAPGNGGDAYDNGFDSQTGGDAGTPGNVTVQMNSCRFVNVGMYVAQPGTGGNGAAGGGNGFDSSQAGTITSIITHCLFEGDMLWDNTAGSGGAAGSIALSHIGTLSGVTPPVLFACTGGGFPATA